MRSAAAPSTGGPSSTSTVTVAARTSWPPSSASTLQVRLCLLLPAGSVGAMAARRGHRSVRAARARAGLPTVRLHDLRHYVATRSWHRERVARLRVTAR